MFMIYRSIWYIHLVICLMIGCFTLNQMQPKGRFSKKTFLGTLECLMPPVNFAVVWRYLLRYKIVWWQTFGRHKLRYLCNFPCNMFRLLWQCSLFLDDECEKIEKWCEIQPLLQHHLIVSLLFVLLSLLFSAVCYCVLFQWPVKFRGVHAERFKSWCCWHLV